MRTRLSDADPGFVAAFSAFLAARRDAEADVRAVVADILAAVRRDGDAAVVSYTQRFDGFPLTETAMRVPDDEIAAAVDGCDPAVRAALDVAATRIEAFHRRQLPEAEDSYTDDAGVRLGLRWTPIGACGIYAPGGKAAYPSSVLMNALPARVAGVDRLVMVTPAPSGQLVPAVLAAAVRAGITEIYRIGGAQAIGALAYGTETIPAVDKIVGPGNAYVAEAKRQVFGEVGIDMIAGPTEVLVIADRDNDPDWIAADLMSQAEHDESAQSVLITDDADFADRVVAAVEDLLRTLPRANIAAASWRTHGAVILVGDLYGASPALVDRIAPEHLELAVADPDRLARSVRHAGAVFLGRHAPEAIGDYVAGPNHVLPTGRSARFSSGLGVLDFLKRTTLVGCDAEALARIGGAAVTLARAEGLDGHARSVTVRVPALDPAQ